MHRLLLPIILLGLLAISALAAASIWGGMSNISLGAHGWVALGLGVVFSMVIGGGLMALAFYSSRHGYDESASNTHEDDHAGR